MQPSEKKVGVDVDGEKGERGDSNAVLQDHQEQAEDNEENFVPKIPEAKMGHEQRYDEKRHTGANAAALLGYLDADLGEMKHQTLAQSRDACDVEQHTGYPCRALLKKEDDAIEKKIGDWNHQEQKEKWEVGCSQASFPEEEGEAGDPNQCECQNPSREPKVRAFTDDSIMKAKSNTGGEEKRNGARRLVSGGLRREHVAFQVKKDGAKERDDHQMGMVVLRKS